MHATACQHRDRSNPVVHGCAAARIHGVGQALALYVPEMPVVARGGHGKILQLDDPAHCATSGLGLLQRHGPGTTARLPPHGAQFTVQCHQRMAHPLLLQHRRHAVHRVALGDAAQVDLHRRVLACAALGGVQLQAGMGGWMGGTACAADGGGIGRGARRAKAPGVHQRTHADVEGALAQAADVQCAGQDVQHLARQVHPSTHRRVVQAHQVAVGLPGRHLRIHPLHGSGQVLAQGVPLRLGPWCAGDGPARTHGGPVQRGMPSGSGFRTHLRHNVPPL